MPRIFNKIEERTRGKLSRTDFTYDHSKRVASLMEAMATEGQKQGVDLLALGALTERHADKIPLLRKHAVRLARTLGFVHDVGKHFVTKKYGHWIWEKKGLNEHEREIIRTHSPESYWFLHSIPRKHAELVAEMALNHHARWDGKGYPLLRRPLNGKMIPRLVRYLVVADSLDAMVFARPYHYGEEKSLKQAMAELKRNAGTQFDPEAVALVKKMVGEKHPALRPFTRR